MQRMIYTYKYYMNTLYFHTSDTEKKEATDNEADDNVDSKVRSDPIEKYKALLLSIEQEETEAKKKDVEMEVTWNVGAEEKAEKLVKEKAKSNEELTPFEQYLEKRKAKKKAKREEKKLKEESRRNDSEDSLPSDVDTNDEYFAEELTNGKSLSREKEKKNDDEDNGASSDQEEDRRKAELELLLMDQDEDGKKHFNMKEIEENATLSKSKRKRLSKKKKKKKTAQEDTKEDDFEVDVKDPRFAALFTSHHFNIDPADPHYRKTKGTETLVSEKLKRRADDEARVEDVSKMIDILVNRDICLLRFKR